MIRGGNTTSSIRAPSSQNNNDQQLASISADGNDTSNNNSDPFMKSLTVLKNLVRDRQISLLQQKNNNVSSSSPVAAQQQLQHQYEQIADASSLSKLDATNSSSIHAVEYVMNELQTKLKKAEDSIETERSLRVSIEKKYDDLAERYTSIQQQLDQLLRLQQKEQQEEKEKKKQQEIETTLEQSDKKYNVLVKEGIANAKNLDEEVNKKSNNDDDVDSNSDDDDDDNNNNNNDLLRKELNQLHKDHEINLQEISKVRMELQETKLMLNTEIKRNTNIDSVNLETEISQLKKDGAQDSIMKYDSNNDKDIEMNDTDGKQEEQKITSGNIPVIEGKNINTLRQERDRLMIAIKDAQQDVEQSKQLLNQLKGENQQEQEESLQSKKEDENKSDEMREQEGDKINNNNNTYEPENEEEDDDEHERSNESGPDFVDDEVQNLKAEAKCLRCEISDCKERYQNLLYTLECHMNTTTTTATTIKSALSVAQAKEEKCYDKEQSGTSVNHDIVDGKTIHASAKGTIHPSLSDVNDKTHDWKKQCQQTQQVLDINKKLVASMHCKIKKLEEEKITQDEKMMSMMKEMADRAANIVSTNAATGPTRVPTNTNVDADEQNDNSSSNYDTSATPVIAAATTTHDKINELLRELQEKDNTLEKLHLELENRQEDLTKTKASLERYKRTSYEQEHPSDDDNVEEEEEFEEELEGEEEEEEEDEDEMDVNNNDDVDADGSGDGCDDDEEEEEEEEEEAVSGNAKGEIEIIDILDDDDEEEEEDENNEENEPDRKRQRHGDV